MPSTATEDTNIGSIENGTITRKEILTINGKAKADITVTTTTTTKMVTINPSSKF